jgi:hypothetical protein
VDPEGARRARLWRRLCRPAIADLPDRARLQRARDRRHLLRMFERAAVGEVRGQLQDPLGPDWGNLASQRQPHVRARRSTEISRRSARGSDSRRWKPRAPRAVIHPHRQLAPAALNGGFGQPCRRPDRRGRTSQIDPKPTLPPRRRGRSWCPASFRINVSRHWKG